MNGRLTLAASFAAGFMALGGASLVFTTPALADAAGGESVSRAVAKPLKAAQDAMKARRYQEASAKLKEVQAIPGKTEYDQYLIDEMMGFIAITTKNYSEAKRALEATLNSRYFPQSDVPRRVTTLASVNYQLKNYDKTLEYGQRAVRGGYADDSLYTIMGQSYYLKGDYRATQRFVENQVDAIVKRGQRPKEQTLQLVRSACDKLNDDECATRNYEKLVAYYPKTEYWQNLLSSILRAKGQTDKNLMHVYRLASEVDILKQADDYTEMAQLAQDEGAYGEAERTLQKGFERKVFADERTVNKNKRLLTAIQGKLAQDKAALAKEAQAAAAAQTGDEDINVGIAYLGYQQYAEAIAAFERGLGKPRGPEARSVADVKLLLGIAQLEAGNKDAAVKSFRSVKGDPKLERLANLWSLHARQA
jgi:tetratricopeptide (TPR) repeat protein